MISDHLTNQTHQCSCRNLICFLPSSFTFCSLFLQEQQDPFSLVADELSLLANRLRSMVAAEVSDFFLLAIIISCLENDSLHVTFKPGFCLTQVPKLASAAEYFFKMGVEGKRFRPTVIRTSFCIKFEVFSTSCMVACLLCYYLLHML